MQGWSSRAPGRDDVRFAMEPRTFTGYLVAIAAVTVIAALSYQSLHTTENAAESLTRTAEVQTHTEVLLSTLKDAETGQRGYLLTGNERYLEPYNAAVASLGKTLGGLRRLVSDNPEEVARLDAVEQAGRDKMAELQQTVELRRSGQATKALAVVQSDRGKHLMDEIRVGISEMRDAERALARRRQPEPAGPATKLVWALALPPISVCLSLEFAWASELQLIWVHRPAASAPRLARPPLQSGH